MDNLYVRTLALAGVAIKRADAEDVETARRALSAALTASRGVDDPEMRPWVLLAIGEAHAAIGDVEGARAIMNATLAATEESSGSWLRVSAARSVAKAQAKSGNYAAALATVERLDDSLYRMLALLEIAAALPK